MRIRQNYRYLRHDSDIDSLANHIGGGSSSNKPVEDITSYARYNELRSMGFDDAKIRKFKQGEEKRADTSATELEKILEGRNEKYWKISDRLHALSEYVNSDYSKSDSEKLQNETKYEEVKTMLEKLKNSKSLSRLSDSYKRGTIGKIESYLKELKKQPEINQPNYTSPINEEDAKIEGEDKIKRYLRINSKVKTSLPSYVFKTEDERAELKAKRIASTSYSSDTDPMAEFYNNQYQSELKSSHYVKIKPVIKPQTPKPTNIVQFAQEKEKRSKKRGLFGKIANAAAGIAIAISSFYSNAAYAPEINTKKEVSTNYEKAAYVLPEQKPTASNQFPNNTFNLEDLFNLKFGK